MLLILEANESHTPQQIPPTRLPGWSSPKPAPADEHLRQIFVGTRLLDEAIYLLFYANFTYVPRATTAVAARAENGVVAAAAEVALVGEFAAVELELNPPGNAHRLLVHFNGRHVQER